VFSHRLDSVSFNDTRYINSHVDYEEHINSKRKYQKAFKTEENTLSIYPKQKSGIIPLNPKDTIDICYVIYDTKFNKSTLKFKLNVLPGLINTVPLMLNSSEYLLPNSEFETSNTNGKIHIPEGCVYEPISKNLKTSNSLSIGKSSTPIQKSISIELPYISNSAPPEKQYITVNSGYIKTKLEDGILKAESKTFGTFCVKEDTIPPIILTLNFLKTDTLLKKQILQWKILDGKTSIVDYDLFIDGEWVLLEFESKGSYAFYRKPKDLIGQHLLKIVAKDACGNTSFLEQTVYLENK